MQVIFHLGPPYLGSPSRLPSVTGSPLTDSVWGASILVQDPHRHQSLVPAWPLSVGSPKEQTSTPARPFQQSQSLVSWEFLLPWPQLRRGKGTPDETRHFYSLLAGAGQQFNFVLKTEPK